MRTRHSPVVGDDGSTVQFLLVEGLGPLLLSRLAVWAPVVAGARPPLQVRVFSRIGTPAAYRIWVTAPDPQRGLEASDVALGQRPLRIAHDGDCGALIRQQPGAVRAGHRPRKLHHRQAGQADRTPLGGAGRERMRHDATVVGCSSDSDPGVPTSQRCPGRP